jgi:hypothetical protein
VKLYFTDFKMVGTGEFGSPNGVQR